MNQKNRKIIRKDDEFGVSPVIAVILMVAITVVLAGVLYAWLMGITTVNPPKTKYEAIVNEKYTHWEIEIVSYSGDPIALEEAKIELISKAKTIKLRTSVSEANPTSITSGLSTIYPIPADSTKPVHENATAGDGEIVDTNSVDRPQVWTDCSIAFLDAEGDSDVNPGDVIWVFKDWNADKIADAESGFQLKLIDSDSHAVLTEGL